jgi:hypothetical protein
MNFFRLSISLPKGVHFSELVLLHNWQEEQIKRAISAYYKDN